LLMGHKQISRLASNDPALLGGQAPRYRHWSGSIGMLSTCQSAETENSAKTWIDVHFGALRARAVGVTKIKATTRPRSKPGNKSSPGVRNRDRCNEFGQFGALEGRPARSVGGPGINIGPRSATDRGDSRIVACALVKRQNRAWPCYA